ncbi:histidine phosphatase family protein [Micromonospora sp. CA-244673]|uniref:histidine phosphatase family protein n=1 Tax=Micromonospora sp. CA-244673 TaxID=3239958 RepID=UPI003D8C9DC1
MTSTPVRLVLWRHGESVWNRERRCQGQADPPLSARGLAQARAAARRLATLRPTSIVSSDLSRALDGARALSEIADLPVATDKRLREVGKGSWEGLTFAEIERRHPEEFHAWRRGRDVAGSNGERLTYAIARATEAAYEAVEVQPPGAVVIASTHGGLIRLLVAALVGLPRWRTLARLDNAASAVLAHKPPDGWTLLGYNTLPEDGLAPEGPS